MSDYSIAIKIAGQLESSFNQAIKNAQGGLSRLGVAGKLGGAAIKATGAAMAVAGTGIAAVGAYSINAGKDFESAMSSVAATADATGKDYKKLEAAAREMGRTTSKTAAESANALEYMALAGWNTNTSIKALPSVLRLSEASGMDLARTSDLVTDSMAALGVNVKQLPSYLDIAAKAQNKSNQSAEQLMEAYLNVGGTMKDLGVPIEESAAALGVMANRGRKGGEAGQALSAIMANLTTGTGQAGKMMKKLGISAFDSEGNFIGLQNTLKVVNNALKGTTDKERNAALAALGGKQHVKDLNKLLDGLNTTNKKGVSEWDELTKQLNKSDGALEKMAKRKMDNLAGDITILSSATSDFGISIYKHMQKPLRVLAQYGTKQIGVLSKALKGGGFSGLASAIGNVISDGLVNSTKYAPKFVSMASTIVDSLISGISQNSSGIASAAGNIITTFANGIFSLTPQIALTGIDIVLQLANSLTSQAPQLVTSGVEAITGFIDGLMQRGPDIANTALNLVQTLASGVIQNASTLLMSGVQLIDNLAQGIQANLPKLIPAAMQALVSFSGSLRTNAGKLVDAGLNLVMTLAQSLISNIPVFIQTIPTIVTNIAGIINDNAPKLLSAGLQLAVQLLAGIIQAVPTIIANIPQIIQAVVSVFTAFNWMALGSQVVTFIGNGIRTAITSIPQIFSNFVQTAQSIVTSFSWRSLGRGIIMTIANGIKGMITSVPQIFKNMGHFAIQGIKSIDWRNVGTTIIKLIGTAISGAGGFIVDSIKGIGSGIIDGIKGIFGKGDKEAEESGKSTASSYASGITANTSVATQAASTLGTNAFSNIDFSGAATAGQAGAATFNTNLNNNINSSTLNLPNIGINNDILKANMSTAGTESANAFNTSFSQSLSIANTSALTNGIGTAGTKGAAALTDGFTAGSTGVTAAVNTLGLEVNTSLDTTWHTANTSAKTAMQTMNQTVSTSTRQMILTFKSMSQSVTSIVQQMGSSIQNSLNSIDLSASGTNMMQGLVNGINSMRSQVEETARDVAKSAAQSVNSALQIHSPSRLMVKSGQFIDEGLALGMRDNSGSVKAAAQAAITMPVINTSDKIQSNMMHPIADARKGMQTSRVREALNHVMEASTVHNNTVHNQSESNPTFVFNPTYQIQGNANKDDLSDVAKFSYEDFKKFAKRFNREQGRERFA